MLFLKKIDVDFHIIVLTETHLSDVSYWIDLPGWSASHSNRKAKGGSVSMLVDSRHNCI